MRPRPMVIAPPLTAIAKPSGVVRGTTLPPKVSLVPAWMRRAVWATESFQSQSVSGRPCWRSTPL
jgi:hypothetical protein